MELILKLKILGYLYKYSGWLFWINRAIYRSFLGSAQNGLILLFGYAVLLIMVAIDTSYLHIATSWHELILSIAFCPLLLVCGYLLLGQYYAGVVKIDLGAETGISFEQSMNLCTKSFRFLGVAAAKLSEKEEAFKLMAIRCIKNGNSPQLILCKPSSPVTKQLEGIAQVGTNKFAGKINKSYAAIKAIEEELHTKLEVHQYHAENYDDMPLFRLIFIDDKYCVVNGGDYGKDDHGIKIPQFLVCRSNEPAFYKALERYFNQVWKNSTEWDRNGG